MPLPPGNVLASTLQSVIAVAADGSRFAYVANAVGAPASWQKRGGSLTGGGALFVRSLDSVAPVPVPGPQFAADPSFSADGHWLAYVDRNKLKRVAVDGGAPAFLADVDWTCGSSWLPNGKVVFADGDGVRIVDGPGAAPRRLTTREPAKGESSHCHPDVLPGGKAALFVVERAGHPWDEARIELVMLDSGARKGLIEGGTSPHYSPTGHLVFGRGNKLLAAPFDLDRLEITGAPTPVLENVVISWGSGKAQYAFSADGTLVYLSGTLQPQRPLRSILRSGASKVLTEVPRNYDEIRISPDGQRVALNIRSSNDNLWLYDIPRGTLTRLTSEEENQHPLWTPDGRRITFSSRRAGAMNLFWQPWDGSGAPEQLAKSPGEQYANAWSPDGKTLVFTEDAPDTQADLWLLSLSDRQPRSFLRTPFNESDASIAPDGRWIAYTSDLSGRDEVYVQPFPGPGGRTQVSTAGGSQPRWSRKGDELFFIEGKQLVSAPVRASAAFEARKAQPVLADMEGGDLPPSYDAMPDGQAFVVATHDTTPPPAPLQLQVVLNWFEELKQKVPGARR